MTAPLSIFLLGNPSLVINEEPVTGFISNKAMALVYYLATTGRSHGRDALAGLLWGDFPENKAKKNLRDVLSNLRRVMGGYLMITRQTVALNEEAVGFIDVADLLATWQVAEQAGLEGELLGTAVSALHSLTDLYQGALLEGFYLSQAIEFEDWLFTERERLQQLAVQALHLLATYYTQQRDFSTALSYYGRLLSIEPWREEAHRYMMRLLTWSGQRTAALNQYDICSRILERELGVEPELETSDLYDLILNGELPAPEVGVISLSAQQEKLQHHNLPNQLSPFVGRDVELSQILNILGESDTRLLSFVGPGGIGKTRLSLQVANQLLPQDDEEVGFVDGVYFVSLSSLELSELNSSYNPLAAAIADTLRLSFSAAEDLFIQLKSYLSDKCMLLVIDNFEHLLPASASLVDLLEAAPNVKMVVTSRGRLNVRGERTFIVGGLEVPQASSVDVQSYSAIQLFLQTAQVIADDFELHADDETAVIEICRLVDGLPLGVELAATWVRFLSIQEIAAEIRQSLGFLESSMRDVPERHRSLKTVFDYSWNLLSADERLILSKLSTLRGSFSREAAKDIANASLPVLASLVDSSLVRRIVLVQGQVRYILLEVVRQYAADKLAEQADVFIETNRLYGSCYLTLLTEQSSSLQGEGQQEALSKIGLEIENIRFAWRWAISERRLDLIANAIESLFHFYDMRSWFQESEDLFRRTAEMAADMVADDPSPENQLAWGKLLARQGWFTFHIGRQVQARGLLAQSLGILRPLNEPRALIFPLNYRGVVEFYLGGYEVAQKLCRESLALSLEVGDKHGAAIANNILGQIAFQLNEYEQAQASSQQSLSIEKEIGNRWSMAFSLINLGNVAYVTGKYVEATTLFQQSLAINEEMGDLRGMARCLNQLAETAVALNNYTEAQALYEQSLAIFREIGNQWGMTTSLTGLGNIARQQDGFVLAKKYFDDALERAVAIQAKPRVLDVIREIAELFALTGDESWLNRLGSLKDRSREGLDTIAQDILKTAVPPLRVVR